MQQLFYYTKMDKSIIIMIMIMYASIYIICFIWLLLISIIVYQLCKRTFELKLDVDRTKFTGHKIANELNQIKDLVERINARIDRERK